MSKHTLGPWFIWKERAMQEEGLDKDEIEYELSEQDSFDVMAGTPKGKVTRGSIAGCRIVVTLDEDSFGDDEDEGRQLALANARLIAAAPDLLEELKQMVRAYVRLMENGRDRIRYLGGDCDPVDKMEADDPNLRAAKAAIAKATGKA